MSDIYYTRKCQYCGRSYDYRDSDKAGTEYEGLFCSPKCNYESRRTGAFTPISSSSSRSSGGADGCLGLLSLIPILLIIWFFRYVSDHYSSPNYPNKAVSKGVNQGSKVSTPPRHIVFVNKTDQKTLNYIRQNYSGDAFIKYRESVNRESIQVASFLDYSKADSFAKTMIRDPKINSGEVGN